MKNTAFLITENHYPKDYVLKKSLESDSAMGIAKRILAEVMIFRRVPETTSLCGAGCPKCASPHLPKIILAVKKNEPVTFILPAFPGKSPNPEKVLGPLPDHAERLSLNFLGTLCQRIKTFYTPGIKMILCSDGRVFSDVVGMNESDVTAYQLELDRLIKEMSLADLSIFNLDYFYKDLHFVQMRDELMKRYGQSLDFLKQKIRNGAKPSASPDEQEANRMYSGITRFLFEDAMHAGQSKSRTAIQKESRSKAYEVIRRSNAWSALIAERFPEAVRLSIHPQTCGSKKLGIRLIGNESWMTPWHGVAVESRKGYVLLKRSEAEALGAKLVCASDGRHSHYQLMAEV
ncbi:L-tyrosine/L-tryptophan isonitrile synthase family protein [Legionella pneumophila]|uniref:Pyoverdine biosynthesis protein PvcA n=1 Tax=Legionella pneumophila subsp. pascullei TaxID=91890 RepID=A0AAX2IUP6_LEGPN|nr:isocyanide synthase family protein [Legionella pneumophila]AMP91260.1 pyoverdine biosynthesis protein PvcA [Legionella pneumophila subsp. pascullei]AMP94247.1 pyoverdine biosynthesis protein PvcA [Legionella pneumophila subsp. pascullei]SQG89028.1 pyoverdine biosynthesis protein PvcA [Legionella pneumophila subsp. pascullei]VEH04078.1 pyoverdine biosynthesis protein PvcA [Legionella pneumophila subsp. pascullei]HDU8260923.1 isocyanide synthase family protein [Legionella pneumophila]